MIRVRTIAFALVLVPLEFFSLGRASVAADTLMWSELRRATNARVQWDKQQVFAANVTCHGGVDKVAVGYEAKSVLWVGFIRSGSRRPAVFRFAVNPAREEAVCQVPVKIVAEPHVCTDIYGERIARCDPNAKACTNFRIDDSSCDSLHFHWDPRHKQVTWGRE
jgi:hypothetical protein